MQYDSMFTVCEFLRLLWCYAAWDGLIPTFRDFLWVPSSRVNLLSCTNLPLKMGPTGSPKTSVSNHLKPRNNPEGGWIFFNHGGSLRPLWVGDMCRHQNVLYSFHLWALVLWLIVIKYVEDSDCSLTLHMKWLKKNIIGRQNQWKHVKRVTCRDLYMWHF